MKTQPILRAITLLATALALAAGLWGMVPVVRAATCETNGTGGGDWNSSSTWQNCEGVIPQSGDSVEILDGDSVRLTANASVGGGTVGVQNGGLLNLSSYSLTAGTLRIYSGGEVQQGGSGTAPPGAITTRSYASNSTYTFNGTQSGLSGSHPTYGNLRFAPTPETNHTFALNLVIQGDLTIALGNDREIRFATATTARSHSIAGNLNVQSGTVVGSHGSSSAGSATVTIGGNLNVTGGTFRGVNDAGSATFNIAGNITNNGTWERNDGNATGKLIINLNGTTQSIGGTEAISVDDLTVASGTTVVIPTTNSPTVADSLTNNGALRQTRNVSTDNTAFLNIGTTYYGVEIDPDSIAMGDTTVTINGNQFCPNASNGVRRCFEIDPGSSESATVRFYFTEAERNGQTLSNLKVWHWSGSAWTQETGTTSTGGSGDAQWVQVTGVSAYSPFLLSENTPTAINLARFEATPQGTAILVAWETASELDNVGFNLYRSETADGPYTQRNATLIPPQFPGEVIGGAYEWLDTDVQPGIVYYYKLEDLDVKGVSTFHGPISTAVVTAPTAVGLQSVAARGMTTTSLTLGLVMALGLAAVYRRRRSRST